MATKSSWPHKIHGHNKHMVTELVATLCTTITSSRPQQAHGHNKLMASKSTWPQFDTFCMPTTSSFYPDKGFTR